MTASVTMSTLNQADYQRYRVPDDLRSFGSLKTALGHLPLQAMDLQGDIAGLLYHLKLKQRFYNVYGQPLEATYIFPMPSRAAVSSFVMQTQHRRIEGKLEERGQARREYQAAIAAGKQAAMAEEERSEVFTMTVGNIPPGEWVEIELELDGPLSWADDQAMFRFPLVVGERYMPGQALSGQNVGSGTSPDTQRVPDASRISPPRLLPGYPNPVALSIELLVHNCGLHLEPPSSSLPELTCRAENGGLHISLPPTCDRLNQDLILRFPLLSGEIQTTLWAQSISADEHYLMLNLLPDLPTTLSVTPRQVVTLLDRSGSMQGWKMACARRTVGRLIDSLTDKDAFQVFLFDNHVSPLKASPSGLNPGLEMAHDRHRYQTLEQLSKVEASGGTEILAALQAGVAALRGQSNPYLVLITDGQVGNESEVLRWVQQNALGIRIFCVGIERAINQSLLERLAQVSGGHFTLVESEEQLDECMANLRKRIQAPILDQVQLRLAGCSSPPAPVPLFAGTCSRLLAQVRGPLPAEVEVLARRSDGSPWQTFLPVQPQARVSLRKVWARERVLELEHGFLAGWNRPECQPAAIVAHSLEHGVLCRFTAFVAVDHLSRVEGPLHQVTQAVSQVSEQATRSTVIGSASKRAAVPSAAPRRAQAPMLRQASASPFYESPPEGLPGVCFSPAPAPSAWAPQVAADAFATPAEPLVLDPFAAPTDPFASFQEARARSIETEMQSFEASPSLADELSPKLDSIAQAAPPSPKAKLERSESDHRSGPLDAQELQRLLEQIRAAREVSQLLVCLERLLEALRTHSLINLTHELQKALYSDLSQLLDSLKQNQAQTLQQIQERVQPLLSRLPITQPPMGGRGDNFWLNC